MNKSRKNELLLSEKSCGNYDYYQKLHRFSIKDLKHSRTRLRFWSVIFLHMKRIPGCTGTKRRI